MDQQTKLHTVDGFEISTILTQGTRSDIVIWMHGISVNKDEYLGFFRDGTQFLAREGFVSIRFDFRGHGESSGSSLDFSIIGQNLDVKSVIEFARKNCGVKNPRLHVVGASFGAPPAIFAAGRYPDIIHTVCLISPVLSYQRTFLRPETEWTMELFSEEKMKLLEESGQIYLDSEFCISRYLIEEMHVIRPDVALSELKQSVLVFHGNRDSMVPHDATVEICYGLRNVKLVTMDGVDHGFMLEGDDKGTNQGSIANKNTIYRQLLDHLKC